jgi:hypothetical protein
MTHAISRPNASTLWIVLLTVASTVTTLVLACATPFPSLAALAAVHMRQRDGIVLMLLAWLASQIIGFGVLGYPHDPKTLAWGVGIATAAIASALGAYAALRLLRSRHVLVQLALAYVAAFLAFKAALLVWSFFLGGVAIALDPQILRNQLVRNGEILVGLYLVYRLAIAIGVPAPQREPAVA